MARGLILVRHAMPMVSETLPSTQWRLSEHSKQDCVLMAHVLPKRLGPVVYCSTETKAYDTARVIAIRRSLRIEPDEAFGEVLGRDEWMADSDTYRDAAANYLIEGRPGWEAPSDVARRFAAGVERALAANPKGDLIVVNHGLALSLYLALQTKIDLVPFWRALTFPDAWRLDLETGELTHLFKMNIH